MRACRLTCSCRKSLYNNRTRTRPVCAQVSKLPREASHIHVPAVGLGSARILENTGQIQEKIFIPLKEERRSGAAFGSACGPLSLWFKVALDRKRFSFEDLLYSWTVDHVIGFRAATRAAVVGQIAVIAYLKTLVVSKIKEASMAVRTMRLVSEVPLSMIRAKVSITCNTIRSLLCERCG
jgi:hypothetical protein